MRHLSDSLYQTLLEINNILVREVTPEGLFRSQAEALQSILHCDRCSLTIYEHETDSHVSGNKRRGNFLNDYEGCP